MVASRPTTRPQLPYLATPFRSKRPNTRRPISTETLDNVKYQLRLGLYWSVLGWTALTGLSVAYFILQQDWLDKQYPAPLEWPWIAKFRWRCARWDELTRGKGLDWIDWVTVGVQYRNVVYALERTGWGPWVQPEIILSVSQDLDKSIPGLDETAMRAEPDKVPDDMWKSRIGYDVSQKSESWRSGYWESMMGMAKSAEMLVGYLTYSRGPDADMKTYPGHRIRSEQNPYPTPIPPGLEHKLRIPDEEDCSVAYESPDFHYLRILTTKGFSRKQRLDTGVAYAVWLDASNRPQLAEQMYRWSLDLACEGVPQAADKIVDRKTCTIQATAPFVTNSILQVVTALASHHARHENISSSLNMYLSILRAHRAAPEAPLARQYLAPGPDYSLTNIDSILRYIAAIPWPGKYLGQITTGDEPFERTQRSKCEEAAIMTYVGEILFSRSGKRAEGLSWTRDAAAIAEQGHLDEKLDAPGREVCTQCFDTGLGNWKKMVGQLATEKAQRQQQGVAKAAGWLWASRSAIVDDALVEQADWKEEERRVTDKIADFEEARLNRRLNAMIIRSGNLFVV